MKKIRVFTDGACSENPGPGGWAAVFCLSDKNIVISGGQKNTTNNRMELLAVIKAIEKVISKRKRRANLIVEIHSDSAYVVNAIEKDWVLKWQKCKWKTTAKKDVKNRDLWEKLLELMNKESKMKIRFIKVKGHSGNMFNEMADRAAVKEVDKIKKAINK